VIIDATIRACRPAALTVVCPVAAAGTDADACDSNDYTAFGAACGKPTLSGWKSLGKRTLRK
jgi:hypothetical protein